MNRHGCAGLYIQQQFGDLPTQHYPPPLVAQGSNQPMSPPDSADITAQQQPSMRQNRSNQRKAALEFAKRRKERMREERWLQHQSFDSSGGQGIFLNAGPHNHQQGQHPNPQPGPSYAQHMRAPLPPLHVTALQPEPFCPLPPLSSRSMLIQGFGPHSGPKDFDISQYSNHWQGQPPQPQPESKSQIPLPSFQSIWGQPDPLNAPVAHIPLGYNPPGLNPHFPLSRCHY